MTAATVATVRPVVHHFRRPAGRLADPLLPSLPPLPTPPDPPPAARRDAWSPCCFPRSFPSPSGSTLQTRPCATVAEACGSRTHLRLGQSRTPDLESGRPPRLLPAGAACAPGSASSASEQRKNSTAVAERRAG